MPKFVHELPDAKALFETLAEEMKLLPNLVEKDYWVMHCRWGLKEQGFGFELKGGTSLSKGWDCIDRFSEDIDIRFEPPQGLNLKGDKPAHIEARFAFYDGLAGRLAIPAIAVERNRAYDDDKARNGGISLRYDSHFDTIPELKPEVLLEVGFARTAPNEPRDFGSWVLSRALEVELDVIDNKAKAIKCFNPEYTFVDKLQTICRRFRQHRERNSENDRPRQFLRHYYDLYKLLELVRVNSFMGTPEYKEYKQEKLRGKDLKEFKSRNPFTLTDEETFHLFEKEYDAIGSLLFSPGPTFREVMDRVKAYSDKF